MAMQYGAAIVAAVMEDRVRDAATLAQDAVDGSDNPAIAVVEVALAARLLVRNPNMSPKMIAMLVQADRDDIEIDGDSLKKGAVGLEILDVIEAIGEDGEIPPEAQAILDRFDLRPGSGGLMADLCKLALLLVGEVGQQMGLMHKDYGEARRHAFASARSVMSGKGGLNPFTGEPMQKPEDTD